MMRTAAICTALLVCRVSAQERDTSFTTWSAWQSIAGEYPDARPVAVQAPSGWKEDRNVPYASVGGRALLLDLYVPDDAGFPLPCVLLIHGGGWRSGSKEQEAAFAQALAVRGFVTATVEYRLSGEARFPAGVHDLKAAIR